MPLFGTPRDPENRALAVARCYFLLIWRHAPGSPKSPPNEPQIEPKTTPRGPRMPKNVAPNRCSNFDQISAPILAILEPQNGTQNRTKNGLRAQGPPKARPEASREPFGRHFGLILASIWALRGLMFELFRGARLLLLACCLSIAGALFLLRPLLRCSPSELPGYEAQVTKAIASWPRSLVASCLRSSGGRRQEGVAP